MLTDIFLINESVAMDIRKSGRKPIERNRFEGQRKMPYNKDTSAAVDLMMLWMRLKIRYSVAVVSGMQHLVDRRFVLG